MNAPATAADASTAGIRAVPGTAPASGGAAGAPSCGAGPAFDPSAASCGAGPAFDPSAVSDAQPVVRPSGPYCDRSVAVPSSADRLPAPATAAVPLPVAVPAPATAAVPLPAAVPAPATAAVPPSTPAKRPLRVLVVDDSEPVRATIRQMVGLCGDGVFEVIGEAADGTEAVSLANDLKPDAILMDINLPGCDGITAAARILETVPARIVMVSVENGREYFRRAMQIGAVDYLVKPFTPEGLAEALRGVESATDPLDGAVGVPSVAACAPSKGQMIAVCGVKGGVGASTVALNLSLAFGRHLPPPGAALCDLDPEGGLLGVMAGLSPSARAADDPVALGGGAATLVPRARLDRAFWEYGAVVCDVGRAVGLPAEFGQALDWENEGADTVLPSGATPPSESAPVRADSAAAWSAVATPSPIRPASGPAVPASGGAATASAAAVPASASGPAVPASGAAPDAEPRSGRLLLVVTGEVVALHAAARLLSGPAAGLPRDRICLVVNRVGRLGAIRPDEVARTLGLPMWIGLPEDGAAVEAANLGRPLLQHRSRGSFSAAVERLAGRLAAAAQLA